MQLTKMSASSMISWKGPPEVEVISHEINATHMGNSKPWHTLLGLLDIPLDDVRVGDADMLSQLNSTSATTSELQAVSEIQRGSNKVDSQLQ